MIELDSIITNGYVDQETIINYKNKGWKMIATIPALLVHPHAMHTDLLTIFSKYTEPVVDNGGDSNVDIGENRKDS